MDWGGYTGTNPKKGEVIIFISYKETLEGGLLPGIFEKEQVGRLKVLISRSLTKLYYYDFWWKDRHIKQ